MATTLSFGGTSIGDTCSHVTTEVLRNGQRCEIPVE